MNIGSRSDIIELGNPCNLTTKSAKRLAVLLVVNRDGSAPKWVDFVKRSTTTKISLKPLEVGKLVIKSIVKSSQTSEGTGKG